LLVALLIATTPGCGDGIGKPIVQSSLGASGQVATAGTVSAGTTSVAGTGGAAGSMAGSGATAGNSAAGAAGGSGAGAAGVAGAGGSLVEAAGGGSGLIGGPPWGGSAGDWDGRPDFGEGGGTGMPVPPGEYCASVADWDQSADSAERALLEVLNFARQSGVACEPDPPVTAPPVMMRPELRCAARLHSRDMSQRGFFDHVNPDGVGPEDRMRRAGSMFGVASESIARGEPGPSMDFYQVLAELIEAGGSDCNNIADPRFNAVGIGVYDGLWTLDFAGP